MYLFTIVEVTIHRAVNQQFSGNESLHGDILFLNLQYHSNSPSNLEIKIFNFLTYQVGSQESQGYCFNEHERICCVVQSECGKRTLSDI